MTWDEQYKAGQGRYWPNEELVRFLGRTYGPVVTVPCRGMTALDLGCGVAGNTIALTAWGFHVDGCDGSAAALKEADQYMKQWYLPNALGRVAFWQHQLPDELPLTRESLDLVIDVQTIQHLDEPQHGVMYKEIERVLKPGGRFFSMHWTGSTSNAKEIFPAHPELCQKLDERIATIIEQSTKLVVIYDEYISRTYSSRTYFGDWNIIAAVKP